MEHAERIITSVEKHKKIASRYLIFVDGQFAFAVHEEVLIKHRLLKGEQLELEQIQRVLQDEELQKGWSEALKQIGRRPRSEKEIRYYLKRRLYEALLIDKIVSRLKQERYLDDADFANQFAEQRIFSHKKGRRLIKQELQYKGVSQTAIQEALNQVAISDEERIAYELAAKKWKQTSGSTLDKKRKTAAYLMRRGYSMQIVGAAVRQLAQNEPDDESGDDEWEPIE
ncbi:MAG: hypothetical protein K0Q59_5875 [Paenibacillus sp.]|jgi:regulatory protein|nr:hypothetical protein [Paenibacillus sp.]